MARTPSIAEVRQLRQTVKHLKLTFGPEHLQVKSGKLTIETLNNHSQELAAMADTVIFKTANGETVILKEPQKLES